MNSITIYRQKLENPLSLGMQIADIDQVIGKNLKRLRSRFCLTQDQLGEKIGVDGNVIAQIEGGIRGMGKDIMARLCRVLKIETWEFHWTEKAPIIKDEMEQQKVYRHRIEEKLGIAEEVARYEDYQIAVASKQGKSRTELIKEDMGKLEQAIEGKLGNRLQKKKAG